MLLYYTSIRLKITFGPNVCQAIVHCGHCIICMCVEKPHDKCVCYNVSAKSTVKNMVHIKTASCSLTLIYDCVQLFVGYSSYRIMS